MRFFFGESPVLNIESNLPPLNLNPTIGNDFKFNCMTSIPFDEAEKLAKKYLVGQVFSESGKSVKIEDINLFGQGEKMVVDAKLSGSFTGQIYFIGVPFYNKETNSIEIKDLDFDLDTKSVLLKTAKWLFSKTLTKKIQSSMKFPLDENLSSIKNEIQKQLNGYQITNGVLLKGTVNNLNLNDIHLSPDKIKVYFNSTGLLNIFLTNL